MFGIFPNKASVSVIILNALQCQVDKCLEYLTFYTLNNYTKDLLREDDLGFYCTVVPQHTSNKHHHKQ